MKKTCLIVLLIVFSISITNAQTENKNVVKIFPTSILFGKATLGYERVLNENSSFTLNLGIPSGIDPLSYLPEIPAEDISLDNGQLSGVLVMPGYRFNFSKKGAPLGFFIETYLKYESFEMDFNAEYNDNGDLYPVSFLGEYSGMGGGIQMGVQYLVAKAVTLEFSFLGLEAKSANAKLTITDLSGNIDMDELYSNIEADFSDVPLIGNSLEFIKGSNYVGAEATHFFLPGARFAFSIGFSF